MSELKYNAKNKLIIAAVSLFIALVTFLITSNSLTNSVIGTNFFNIQGVRIMFPTAGLLAIMLSLVVFLTLKSFLNGFSGQYKRAKGNLLSLNMQLLCLTAITAYSSFYAQKEILEMSRNNAIDVAVAGSTVFIPTAYVSALLFAVILALVMFSFLSAAAESYGVRQNQALKRLSEVNKLQDIHT